jgi:hypothetical protein
MSGNKGKSGTTPRDTSSLKATRRELALTRRTLVGWLLAAGGAAGEAMAQAGKITGGLPNAKATQLDGKDLTAQAAKRALFAFGAEDDATVFTLLRPRDLLVLNVTLRNLKVTGKGETRSIVIVDPSQTADMSVEHQPQSLVESAWLEDGSPAGQVNNSQRAMTYISGPTRLVYRAPKGFTSIPFTADEVLKACLSWRLVLSPRAVDAIGPGLGQLETIRLRLEAIADAQSADLHAMDPKRRIEPVLRRAGMVVAEAMIKAAQQKVVLSSARIDALIRYEVMASLHPEDLPKFQGSLKDVTDQKTLPYGKVAPQDVKKAVTQKQSLNASDRWMGAYVERVALQEVVKAASPLSAQPRATQARPQAAAPQVTPRTAQATPQAAPQKARPSETPVQFIPGLQFSKTSGSIEDEFTDIEAPFRVHLSPLSTAGFAHMTGVVDHGGRIAELWHTRLGARAGDWAIGDTAQPVRVLYSEDEDMPPLEDAVWPLTPKQRTDLVKLTRVKPGYNGLPAVADHLRLTALGASIDVLGNWPDHKAGGADLSQWKHVSSVGRDQYVRVVEEGFLFPFGHAAAWITITERKFVRQVNGGRVAAMMQRQFVIVRERVRAYPGHDQKNDGRDFPFASVEILTKQTPNLHPATKIDALLSAGWYVGDAKDACWPSLSKGDPGDSVGQPFRFQMALIDTAGNRAPVEMPLIFMVGTANDPARIGKVVDYYNLYAPADNRGAAVNGASIRFSRDIDASGKAIGGESDYSTRHLNFKAWPWPKSTGPYFSPALADADIDVPSLKHLLGKVAAPKVKYHDAYLSGGFDADNPAQVVFTFDNPISLNVAETDKFGGLAEPSLIFDGLSRKVGALNGYADYLKPKLSPADVFKGATLLGVVPLGDIIEFVTADDPGVPKLTSIDQGDKIVTSYTVEKNDVSSAGPFVALSPHTSPQFSIVSTVTVSKTGGTPDTSVVAKLNDFKINLFGFIILHFDSLTLTVKPGNKTDVNPALNANDGVRFGGPLEFVNALRDYIPADGFSDPPALDVTTSGVTASYTLGLPSISVGAMSLQNISLGAGFDLPFTGEGPSARFNFAERHNPFNLTVSLFGGGGFFALAVDTKGVRELEATLEFGAQIAIDLGVASGGVYVKGGFYFRWQDAPDKIVQFEGYVEMGGHLDVLGLITVSLVFHLGLTYEKTSKHSSLYGTATLTVEIDILFFSCSQDITIERQFAGSDADPAFIEYVPETAKNSGKSDVWNAYCAAFA